MKKSAQSGIVHILLLLGIVIIGGAGLYLLSTHQLDSKKLQNGFLTNALSSTDTSYNLNILVIKYFPLSANGQNIDIAVTGDVGDPYTTIQQRTVNVTNNLKASIEKGSRYLGYKDPNVSPALTYQIIDTKEYTAAVPMLSDGTRRPDYSGIMTTHNICDYVDNKGVREVWLWAYQGPTYPGSSYPYLSISESKMAGPFGDISNSYTNNNMPTCKNTYRVYTFNYGRGTSEALESWGHQIEAEISAVDNNLFRNIWQGPNYPQTLGVNGRCGSVHNPPNARFEYDRSNPNPQQSDCLDWNPDSLGQLSSISCSIWGCQQISDNDNPDLNYMVWNWQNLPGRLNNKTYQGSPLRNFWDVHGDFDGVMGTNKALVFVTPTPVPSPAPTSTVVSDTFNRTDNSTSLGNTDTGQPWSVIRGTWGILSNAAYPANGCPAPGYAVVDTGKSDGILEVTATVNPQDARVPFRVIDQDNLYWVERKGGSPAPYELDKRVAGVQSFLGSTSGIAATNGDKIKVVLSGSSIKVYINDKLAISATDSAINSTKHGIGTWCTGSVRFDNFSFAIPVTPTPTPSPTSTPTPTATTTPTPTPSPTPDTIAPTVLITNPLNNSTVYGTVNIQATASDNVGIDRLEFYIDQNFIGLGSTSPYSITWDALSTQNGAHNILVQAYDKAVNIGSNTINITVNNPDTQAPSTPANLVAQALSYNKVNLSWALSVDNIGVTGYWIIRNGVTIAPATTTSFSDTTVNPQSNYSYQVIAFDAVGNNSALSNIASVSTPNAPDVQAPIAPTSLIASAVSQNQINLSWNPSTDNIGVVGYEVYRNNVKIATINTTSYGDTGLAASTSYTYFVKAFDAAGNYSSNSTSVSVITQKQINTGSISGQVKNSSNVPIVSATVSLTVNGKSQRITTNSLGQYAILGLPAANYNVSYAARGYKSVTQVITVTVGQNTVRDVILQKK